MSIRPPKKCEKFILKHMIIINRLVYLNNRIDMQFNNCKKLICSPKFDNTSVEKFY